MTVKTAVKVISLLQSADRREQFTKQAIGAELPWSYFDACTSVTSPLSYHETGAIRRFGRPLSKSEIGCYTSHYKCWEWLANSDYDQAIFMEDDIVVDWAALGALAKADFRTYELDFVRLFTTHPVPWKIVMYRFLSPHHHLVQTMGVVFGMQCYVLTKKAAQKLVKDYHNICAPVDWVMTRYWEHNITNYMLAAHPVLACFVPSTIGAQRDKGVATMSFQDKVTRLGWKIRDRASQIFFDAFKMKKRPLGKTVDEGKAFLS